MKARETIVLALVLSLALVSGPRLGPCQRPESVHGEGGRLHSRLERYWTMTMNQAELDHPQPELRRGYGRADLLPAPRDEHAVRVSDYQVFGVDGYNVLKVPSMPAQGLFLTVNASSASVASPLVSLLRRTVRDGRSPWSRPGPGLSSTSPRSTSVAWPRRCSSGSSRPR